MKMICLVLLLATIVNVVAAQCTGQLRNDANQFVVIWYANPASNSVSFTVTVGNISTSQYIGFGFSKSPNIVN